MRNSSNIDRVRANNVLSYMKLVFNALECATVLRGRARKKLRYQMVPLVPCVSVGRGRAGGRRAVPAWIKEAYQRR